ncbi:MBOAT family O-acyltransferase [Desulfocurvus sp. DL9XJH121]
MLFSSKEFILVFLPLLYVAYFGLVARRYVVGAKTLLVGGSLFFYSWWNPVHLPLILGSVLFNFAVGSMLGNSAGSDATKRRTVLGLGIAANLGLLAYFKYFNFFIDNVNTLANLEWANPPIILPLAISFFTFQQIAYLVDSYQGQTREYDFMNYTLFVTFFPQLISGPIVHHKEMMPQFRRVRNLVPDQANLATGLLYFAIGLFKKVAVADTLATWATAGFDSAPSLTFVEAWLTSLSYSGQLYFDFSGYMDMALGAALMFNIRLPINFDSPYKATDIQDFWRRWHITLSRFLRDYIYIPLGGNRKGDGRALANVLVTFLLGGLWHGAGWNFIFWGLLHGAALIGLRLWKRGGYVLPPLLGWFLTFNFVNVAWVFFRATTWGDALKVLKGMVGLSGISVPGFVLARLPWLADWGIRADGMLTDINGGLDTILWVTGSLGIAFLCRNSHDMAADMRSRPVSYAVPAACLFAYGLLCLNQASEFLYFNF